MPSGTRAAKRSTSFIRGIDVAMLTGDAWPVANAVSAELGIDTVFALVLPEAKASTVRELQAQGKRVAMVGDGVRPGPMSRLKLTTSSW